MSSLPANLQVIVVADDPIEAGMLALDLVQAGAPAHAVRDTDAAMQQIQECRTTPQVAVVVVGAFRELAHAITLWEAVSTQVPAPSFVAVVLRSQRDAAARYQDGAGWAGVAVRPVTADDLVGLVSAAAGRGSASFSHVRTGQLEQEGLLEILSGLIDRIPRSGGGRTALVELSSQDRQGVVALVDGELVHASVDSSSGRHALERMSTWRHGTFSVGTRAWTEARTISGSALALLAVAQEYSRRVEEARLSLPYSDCVCTVRWERVRPLPVVAEALFRRIATGQVLGAAIAGEGDDELEAFAALEARIKRGAVLPQVETAPRATVATDAATTSSMLQSGRRPGSSGDYTAGPMVSAPPTGERRHAHPATNLYRVGEDGQPPPGPSEEHRSPPLADSGLSAAEPAPAARTTHRALQSQDLTQPVAGRRAPTPLEIGNPRPRPASSLLATAGQRNGRVGPVTGWFGIAAGDSGLVEAEDQFLSSRRPRSSVRILDRNEDDDRLVSGPSSRSRVSQPGGPEPKMAARPYAWIPAAQLEEEVPEPPPPKVMALLKPKNWPWAIAGVGGLAVAAWLVAPHPPTVAPQSPVTARYLASVELLDNGHMDRARQEFAQLAEQPGAPIESVLHLAVLEVEARQFDQARTHLRAYLADPAARQAGKARQLFEHVFGPGLAVQPGGPTP